MNILGYLQSILYLIMNALLYPVMGLIVFLFILMLFNLGAFISEFAFRRGKNQDAEDLALKMSGEISRNRFVEATGLIKNHLKSPYIGSKILRGFLKDLAVQVNKGVGNLDIRIENILQEHEIAVSKLLDKTRILVRLGPLLGLMGTLIPMGGALLALSKGDLTLMSNNLIIAFSTTVVGLAVGALAYVVSVVRERWYEEDMKNMEYLTELMIRNIKEPGR